MLKVALLNTPSYNKTSRFCDRKDRCGAYLELLASNEGENFTQQTIENVFSILNSIQ